jgi:cytochrome c-type biogenesis protein CcmE
MTRKQRRGLFISAGVSVLAAALLLVMFALSRHVDVFRTPSALAKEPVATGVEFRLGGLVAEGSVQRGQGVTVTFAVTDKAATIPVRYTGLLPDLFREGQGVIAQGKIDATGTFIAVSILAKHDETYMPPEVAKALKEQGVWQAPKPKAK